MWVRLTSKFTDDRIGGGHVLVFSRPFAWVSVHVLTFHTRRTTKPTNARHLPETAFTSDNFNNLNRTTIKTHPFPHIPATIPGRGPIFLTHVAPPPFRLYRLIDDGSSVVAEFDHRTTALVYLDARTSRVSPLPLCRHRLTNYFFNLSYRGRKSVLAECLYFFLTLFFRCIRL